MAKSTVECRMSYSSYVRGCRCESCCDAAREYGRSYRARNRERLAADKKRWAEANREQVLAAKRLYRDQKRDQIRAGQKDHYRRNSDRVKESVKRYREENAEAIRVLRASERYRAVRRASQARRRARLLEADHGCVAAADYEALLTMPCAYCGAPAEHVDHITPLSKGGQHCLNNLAPACEHCNTSKNASILENPPEAPLTCPTVL